MTTEGGDRQGLALREVRELLRDLLEPRAAIYWPDFLGSAAIGWFAFARAVSHPFWSAPHVAWTVLAALALYRAVLFVHELTHAGKGKLPGFNWVWDFIVGIPLQLPSFMYLGVHLDHHRRNVYGTAADPEYLPLGAGPRWRIVMFAVEPALIPIAFLVRYAVLAPLSLVLGTKVRKAIVEGASSLAINFAYKREPPAENLRVRWLVCEALACAFAWTVLGLCIAGRAPWAIVAEWYIVSVGVGFVNQIRTLGAHRYRNGGAELDVIAQLVDSVNTPGWLLTELWAPVGLRYHGLHHFVPDMPYHALGTAHRRLMASLPPDSAYRRTLSPSLMSSLLTLWRDAGAAASTAAVAATAAAPATVAPSTVGAATTGDARSA